MAKRRKSKAKRNSNSSRYGITTKQYNRLKKEAKNTRSRILAFSARSDADNYIIPDSSLYTLKELLFRIQSGEAVNNVISELRGITSKSILSAGIDLGSSDYGYQMTRDEARELRTAVQKANRSIEEAKKENPDFADVFPSSFNYSELSSSVVSSEYLQNLLSDLAKYNRQGMELVGLPSTGEAITRAELERNTRIIEQENQRRQSQLENQAIANNAPEQFEGFLRSQDRYDTQPIKIENLDRQTLAKRASTWDDPARTYRANLFLRNYEKSLDDFKNNMIILGMSTDDFEDRIDYIHDIIARLYNNEEAITSISKYMPNINIAIISGKVVSGDGSDSFDFSEIYYDWLRIEDEWT